MSTVLTALGTIAFYAFISIIVYMLLRVLEYRSESEMDKYRRAQMKVVALEMITQCEQAKMHEEIESAARGVKQLDDEIPDVPKPCYCLGARTIEKVSTDGQMQTEKVDFVAADDLDYKNPYARLEKLEKLKPYADHKGECKYLEGHDGVCTCGLREIFDGLK